MCVRMCVCGCAEMCGNREIRTVPTFARVPTCAGAVRKLCGNVYRLRVCARNAIPCVQGAENAFPAFSERMTPSGTLYSRLVPDGPFC